MASFDDLINLGVLDPGFGQAMAALAQQVYQMKKLELVDVPLAKDQIERTSIQAANDAVQAALEEAKVTGVYKPIKGWTNTATGAQIASPFLPAGLDASQYSPVYGDAVPTLAAQTQQQTTGLGLLKLLGSLQGDPFAMEQVAHGANALGLSNSVGSITRLAPQLGTFQGPGGNPTSPSLQSLYDMLSGKTGGSSTNVAAGGGGNGMVDVPSGGQQSENASGVVSWTPGQKIYTDPNGFMFVEQPNSGGASWQATGTKSPFPPGSFNAATTGGNNLMSGAMGPTAGTGTSAGSSTSGTAQNPVQLPLTGAAGSGGSAFAINPNMDVAALQNTPVNKWSPQDYFKVKASSPDYLASAVKAAGLNATDVENTMQNLLPQFSAVKFGSVNAGGSISNAQSNA